LPIHIVGLGNIGKLLAHSLRKYHPDIPITLLFHRQSLNEEWSRAGESIEIVRSGIADRQRGFLHEDVSRGHGYIQQLIVATKTHTTVEALKPLRCRLNSSSSLLFLQNGIGTPEAISVRAILMH
jgi:2-dehydropantoate 2-reductase